MASTLYSNPDGIIAVARDGVIVFGSEKVLRGTDVTIVSRPLEHWVVLPSTEFESKTVTRSKFLLEIGAKSIQRIVGGVGFVFDVPSTQTEDTVRAALALHVADPTAEQLARRRLATWRADPLGLVTKSVIDDLIDVARSASGT